MPSIQGGEIVPGNMFSVLVTEVKEKALLGTPYYCQLKNVVRNISAKFHPNRQADEEGLLIVFNVIALEKSPPSVY